ncbi:hypothetical protein BDA99DRAFT_255549 [Phascolomyces articulosus]|uniref:Uncharacterized protein n=1 Tax=Phascolomyces articulosus TaxID=60185 RepID=A0AAD5JP91_9FUNG|nr:hypothetical protein BDA99DRAFT_255549 [Phascolomyces articulosus]
MTSTDYYNNNNNDHDYNDHDKGSPTPAAAHEYDLLVSSIPNEKPKISLDFDRFNNLVSPYDSDVEFMNQDAIVASPLNLETNQVEWISHSHSFENNTQFPFDINHNNDSNNNIQNDDDNDKLDSGGSMSNHHHQQDHVHSPTTPEPSSSTSHIQQEPIIVTDIKVNNSIEYNNEQSILSNNDGIYNKTTKKPTDKLPVPAPPSPSLSSSSISQYEKNNNNSSNKNISHNLSPSSSTTTSSFEMIDPKMTQIIADPSSSTQYNNKITSSNLSSKPSASAEERASWIPVRVLGPSIPMMVEE